MPFPNTSTRASGDHRQPNRRHQPLLLLARDQCGGGGWKHSTRLALCSRPPAWWSLSSPHPRGGHAPPPTHVHSPCRCHSHCHPPEPASHRPWSRRPRPTGGGNGGGGGGCRLQDLPDKFFQLLPPSRLRPPPRLPPNQCPSHSSRHRGRQPPARLTTATATTIRGPARPQPVRPRGYCEGTRRSVGRKGGAGGSGALRALTVRAGACYPATPHHPLNPPMAGWWGAAPQPTQHQCPAAPVITSTRRQCRVDGGWWRQRRRCGGGCGRRRATCGGRRTAPPPRTPAPGEAPPPRALHHVDEACVLALQSHERAGLRTCKNR